MNQLLTSLSLYLDGKKTHLVASAFAVFNVLIQENVVHLSHDHVALINALLAAAGLSMLRLAVNKV